VGMMVVEVDDGEVEKWERKREEVRLCGLAGADEQEIRLSRTGERVRRGEGEGTVEETKRKHTAKRKAGIQVDERVCLCEERVMKEGDEARPHPVRICGWVGRKRPRRKHQTGLVCSSALCSTVFLCMFALLPGICAYLPSSYNILPIQDATSRSSCLFDMMPRRDTKSYHLTDRPMSLMSSTVEPE
jgi:hypothetical protein